MGNSKIDIFKAVKSKEIIDITKDITETTIDQFLKDGLLKDIPLIGTFHNILNLSQKISDSFLTKKILKFLFELNTIPELERKNFIEKLEKDNDNNKIGEKLLIVINGLDDTDKATIIGKIFKKTIEGEIDTNAFMRISFIIDKVYLEDLLTLRTKVYLENIDSLTKSSLSQIGILNQTIKDNRDHEDFAYKNTGRKTYYPPTFEYQLSDYGRIILENGF